MCFSEYTVVSSYYQLFRSTPFEVLHTLLLGPYKYLLKNLMKKLSAEQKKELLARQSSMNYSGMSQLITGNIVYHHQSFVGKNHKTMQLE